MSGECYSLRRMSSKQSPHLSPTQQVLVYGLELHRVPRKTAIRLAGQFTEAHVLRELCYYVYELGRNPKHPSDWHWLVTRIRRQLPAPVGYPVDDPD